MPNQTSQNESPTSAYYFGDVTLVCATGGRLSNLCISLQVEFPALRLERKRDHGYWRALGRIDTFSTTGPNVIGISEKVWREIVDQPVGWENRVWALLSHEREHLRQIKRLGFFLFLLIYFVLPLPILFAFGRAYLERAGYIQTLRCWYWIDRGFVESDGYRDWWIGTFTGPSYGFMWILRGQVARWFDQELKRLQTISDIATFR